MFLKKYPVVATFVVTTFFCTALAASPFAYISNQLDDSVSVIDTQQGKVIGTVSVQGKPAGVAVSPNRDRVYISTPEAHGFAVIDTKKQAVINTVAVSEGALGIAVGTNGRRIYVADWFNSA